MIFEVEQIGFVRSTRGEVRDDGWDQERAAIELDSTRFGGEAGALSNPAANSITCTAIRLALGPRDYSAGMATKSLVDGGWKSLAAPR